MKYLNNGPMTFAFSAPGAKKSTRPKSFKPHRFINISGVCFGCGLDQIGHKALNQKTKAIKEIFDQSAQ